MKSLPAFLFLLLWPALTALGSDQLTGNLETIHGLKVLTLSGSDAEQGFTEGYLCAREIHELFTGFALDNAFVQSAYMWQHMVIPRVKERVIVPDYVRTRARGVLAGMKARDPKSLYIEALKRDIAVDDLVAAVALPDFVGLMCSSFTSWSQPVEGQAGATWVGRNLDYFGTEALTRNLMIIVRAGDDERHAWVSIGYPGLGGCLTGFSDAGVFVAIHDVAAFGRVEETMTPRIVALEDVLRRTASAGKADIAAGVKSILDEYEYGMAGNCMLSWRGGGAVLEFDGQKKDDSVTLRRSGDSRYIACTNHFRKRHESVDECWRYDCIWNGLKKNAPGDIDSAWKLLRSASKEDTLYRIVTNLETGVTGLERRKKPLAGWHEEVRFNFWRLLGKARNVKPRPLPAPELREKAKVK